MQVAIDGGPAAPEGTQGLGVLFMVGGGVVTGSAALATWPATQTGLIALAGLLAAVLGGLMVWRPARVGTGIRHLVVLLGTVGVTAVVLLAGGGSASAGYAVAYTWAPVYTASFSTHRFEVLAHMLISGALYLVAMGALGELERAPFHLLLVLGLGGGAAWLVSHLVDQLRATATTDPLTGLANRRAFTAALDSAVAATERSGRPVSVALFDLDGFKQVNDTRGHDAGDELLCACAEVWTAELRATDTLGRLGGDEFALLMPDTGPGEAATATGRMADAARFRIGVSVGVATGHGDASATELIAAADAAMYRAKHRGGGLTTTEVA